MNKRKKKVTEDAQRYKLKLDDDEDPQQVKINKRWLKVPGDAKSHKDRIGTIMTRKYR